MSDNHEAHKLLIRNVAVLEQAHHVAEEAEKVVFSAIDRKVKAWVELQDGWEGDGYNFLDSDSIAFKPGNSENWPAATTKGVWPVCFALSFFPPASEGSIIYKLPPLVNGASKNEFGVFLCFGPDLLPWLGDQKKRSKLWTDFLKGNIANFPALEEKGFRLEGEDLFRPIKIDPQSLAEAYPQNLNDALAPVDEALALLAEALPEFDRLIEVARATSWS